MKRFWMFLSLLLLVTFLHGCYAPPPSAGPSEPFTIEVKLDKSAYHIGDNIFVTVRANRDCYIALYDISPEGELSQFFPDPRIPSRNYIQGGYAYQIPNRKEWEEEFYFEVTGPPGVARVRVIGSLENVNFFDQRQTDHSLDENLKKLPPKQWAENSVEYQVVP